MVQDSLQVLHKNAVTALNQGDYKRLAGICQALLRRYPNFAEGWFLLAIAAAAAGQVQKATDMLERAVGLDPNQCDYWVQKAKLHSQLNQLEQARESAEKALAFKTQTALAKDTLGVVLTRLGRYKAAVDLLRSAVSEKPQNAQYRFNLSAAEQFFGNLDEARQQLERVIELKPDFARAYWALSELEKNAVNPKRMSQLQSQLARSSLGVDEQLYFAHALARQLEARDDYAAAFEVLRVAKARKKTAIHYTLEDDLALFSAMKTAFKQKPVPHTDDQQLQGKGLLFVLGMPRSGTTLVERMLAAHSEIASLGELQDFPLAVRAAVDSASRKVLDKNVLVEALSRDPEAIGEDYMRRVAAYEKRSALVIDKMPLNFFYIGLIRRCLPRAKILCVRRHPMDTVVSNYRQLFALNYSYYNYHYDIQDTARYFFEFDQLMAFWREWLKQPGAEPCLHEISYEQLVRQPRSTLSSVFEFLQLPWQDACLAFHQQETAVTTASAIQVREKLYTHAVDRWQRYGDSLNPVIAYFKRVGVEI